MSARFDGPVGWQLATTFRLKRETTERKALLIGLICVSVLSVFASPSSAQQPQTVSPWAWVNSGPSPTLSGATPPVTGNPVQVGETPKTFPKVLPGGASAKLCKGTIHSKKGRRCATYKEGRLIKVCVVKSGRGRTCRFFNKNGQVFRICVTRPGEPTKCRRVTAQTLGLPSSGPLNQPDRKLLGLNNQGFANPLIPAVGAIWSGNQQICTGTLIARGIVLTAGHCLYVNDLLGAQLGTTYRGYEPGIGFSPGQTWEDYFGVPIPSHPYGFWQAKQWVVTQGWVNNDDGLDWGLIELYPDANGNYPGDYTGWFTAQLNIGYALAAHAYLTGYPASGVFGSSSFYYGHGQYFCDSTWDQYWYWHSSGSNFSMTHACTMNGGSSGGPVFVQLNDGSWVIGGVISRGRDVPNAGYSDYQHAPYLDDRLATFYNGFVAQL